MRANYSYELIRDEKLGMMVIEFIDNEKNTQWELSYVLEVKNSGWRQMRLDACWKWLQTVHPELLL
jgi:hypothetical protein